MAEVWVFKFGLAVAMALTSHQIFRVIFKQQDLKRASGRMGQLKSVTLHPNAAPVSFPVMDLTVFDILSVSGTPRYTLTKPAALPITRRVW